MYLSALLRLQLLIFILFAFRERSAQCTFSAASGLLHTVLSLLSSNPMTLELAGQHWLNTLAGNLFCGLAVTNMHPVESLPPGLKMEPNSYPSQLWAMFKDKQVCAFILEYS